MKPSSLFFAACLGTCASATSSAAPWPKEIAVIRRRSGLTYKEFLNYHALVHGQKAWNAPRDNSFPATYVQDWIFDAAFGANDSVATQTYTGRDDVTELYGSSATTFITPPPTDYIQTVIGPDGVNFSDLPTAFSMIAYETFPIAFSNSHGHDDCDGTVNAFLWASSTNPKVDNTTFATRLTKALVAKLPAGAVFNASTHVPVPGTDSRQYFGGYGLPTINAVVKLWLTDTDAAITAVRTAQNALNTSAIQLDVDTSFVVFSRKVTIYDEAKNIAFDTARLKANVKRYTPY